MDYDCYFNVSNTLLIQNVAYMKVKNKKNKLFSEFEYVRIDLTDITDIIGIIVETRQNRL